MEEKYQLARPIDFIDGESEARELIYTLADEITNAIIPTLDGLTVPNRWTEVGRNEGSFYVEYDPKRTATPAKYKHTDGATYNVYRINPSGHGATYLTLSGKLIEVERVSTAANAVSPPSGFELNFSQDFTYSDPNLKSVTVNTLLSPDIFIAFIPNDAALYGFDAHLLVQGYYDETDKFIYDVEWDYFESVGILNNDFSYFADMFSALLVYQLNANVYGNGAIDHAVKFSQMYSQYNFQKIKYEGLPVRHVPRMVTLKATPDVPEGITPRDYFVALSQRMDDFNYFDINYGVGFKLVSEAIGDPVDTYRGICDPTTVVNEGAIPVVIDQLAAHLYVKKTAVGAPVYSPPKHAWDMDITNTKEMKSPTTHCFTGRHSTTSWVVDKIRRPDFLVRYWLSINNSRVAFVVEGDPAPSIADYYRSFGYIGKITPFNKYDHAGNFGVTAGMGHLITDQTGYVEADIKENTPEYGKWGEYTSNGMWSMSMFNTRSNVFFQAHNPAFLTQLPDYDAAGTLPPELQRLVLDPDRFQTSVWTSKYHGSPIYMVHRSEGYRGFMDGVVVIEDHNIVTGDELVVDTHILKDSKDPSKGTWEEVYKFFSVNTPVNLFTKYSPAPGKVSVAILKEIR